MKQFLLDTSNEMVSRFLGSVVLLISLLFGLTSEVWATPTFDPCGGGDCTVLGPYPGNDAESVLAGWVGMSVTEIFKSDPPGLDGNGITVTVDPDMFSGTWKSGIFEIDFVVVKAGNEFLIQDYFSAGGGTTSGDWSTFGLTGNQGNQLSISHITFYTKQNGNGAVPEPSTILLFGSGLTGLLAWRKMTSRGK